jgi:hypothetical protein
VVERCELAVLGVAYVGPHSVEGDIYEIELHVQPAPDFPCRLVALKFRAPEARFLAHAVRTNPPPELADRHLLEQVAAHET